VVFSPAEESGARLPFQEEQDRPSLPKGVDPADPAPYPVQRLHSRTTKGDK